MNQSTKLIFNKIKSLLIKTEKSDNFLKFFFYDKWTLRIVIFF